MSAHVLDPEASRRFLRAELHAFLDRPRGPRPHVHRCTECYEDEACGLDCTTDEDDDRPAIQRGGHAVCSLCKPRPLPVVAMAPDEDAEGALEEVRCG